MHLPAHLAMSWLVGHRRPTWRERAWVAWAGVAPDLDALSALAGSEAYSRWHHVLTHGLVAALATFALVAVATRRWATAALAFVAFHLHLVADLLGSGRAWSIAYLQPWSEHEIAFAYGWELNAWPNLAIMVGLFVAIGIVGVSRGHTFTEVFAGSRIDERVVQALRRRFG